MTFDARKYQEEYRQEHPEKIREWKHRDYVKRARNRHLVETYGLSESEYQLLLEKQNGGCAICGFVPNGRALHVDHDHTTGRVRGLLCAICNLQVVNVVEQYSERIEQAIKYLRSSLEQGDSSVRLLRK